MKSMIYFLIIEGLFGANGSIAHSPSSTPPVLYCSPSIISQYLRQNQPFPEICKLASKGLNKNNILNI